MNLDQFTAKYIELRDRRSQLKKGFEAADGELKLMMEKIEDKMRFMLDDMQMLSAKTPHGTVFKTHKEYANVGDWDAILAFVKENDAYDMFERRISKTAVRDRMQQDDKGNYLNAPPPGVNFTRVETVQIRRS
jgi:hypothetical protein